MSKTHRREQYNRNPNPSPVIGGLGSGIAIVGIQIYLGIQPKAKIAVQKLKKAEPIRPAIKACSGRSVRENVKARNSIQ